MKSIVVFASGRGSNCQNIYKHLVQEKRIAQLKLVISDRPDAPVLKWAESLNIPVQVINPRDYSEEEEYGKALLNATGTADFIILAGFLKKIPKNFIQSFTNRIVNIHPALLPAFGGKGYYGMNVHRAVFEYGARVSGITIHLVDEEYDHGPVVMQKCVDISDCHSPEEIANKILPIEHQYYSIAIEKMLTEPYRVEGRRIVWTK